MSNLLSVGEFDKLLAFCNFFLLPSIPHMQRPGLYQSHLHPMETTNLVNPEISKSLKVRNAQCIISCWERPYMRPPNTKQLCKFVSPSAKRKILQGKNSKISKDYIIRSRGKRNGENIMCCSCGIPYILLSPRDGIMKSLVKKIHGGCYTY